MWLSIFLWITILLLAVYAVIILLYRKWFLQLKEFIPSPEILPQTKFSIIIPARNEEENIGNCIQSILSQNYPQHLFELIIVDDHSTDKTSAIVEKFKQQHNNIQLIKLADELNGQILNSYKKKAIEKAIAQSTGDWIITTDADCVLQTNWLRLYDAYIQKNNAVFIGAPVIYTKTNSVLSLFQYIDFMTMQGITAASVSAGFHNMCNGANLAYEKKAFYNVNGFKGIDNVASGDDMMLMNKIKKKYPGKIGFLFSHQAIVSTLPMLSWKDFFNQRIRWASKADKLKDVNVLSVLVIVYMLNLLLFILPFMSFVYPVAIVYWIIFIAAKTGIELLFILPVSKFFGEFFIGWFPVLQPLHIFYIVISGWLGKFGKYSWKERKVS
jgi:cellulose synthase/poly-beta-1,6-N-acetylglucosamine synthase-like glycosyltransferase